MNKLILIAIIATSFLAGTITTGGIVYANFDKCSGDSTPGISNGKPLLEIWEAICDLENKLDKISIDDGDNDDTNEIQKLSVVKRTKHFLIPGLSGDVIRSVSCMEDEMITGGGYEKRQLNTRSSYPEGNSWKIKIENGSVHDHILIVHALCAKLKP